MGGRRQRHGVLPLQDGAEGGREGAGEAAGHEEEEQEEAQDEAAQILFLTRSSHSETCTFFFETLFWHLFLSASCLCPAWFDSGYMFLRQFGGYWEIPVFFYAKVGPILRSLVLWIHAVASVHGGFYRISHISTCWWTRIPCFYVLFVSQSPVWCLPRLRRTRNLHCLGDRHGNVSIFGTLLGPTVVTRSCVSQRKGGTSHARQLS